MDWLKTKLRQLSKYAIASHAQPQISQNNHSMPSETPRQGLSVDFSHGPLKVSDNKRYLVHQDGTPFFYLGCTAWELFHRLNREEADRYLENRRQKGFTVIQAVILAELNGLDIPNPYGDLPLLNNDPTTPNERYFQHVDYIVNKAQEKGIYIGMLPTWADKVGAKLWGLGPEKLIDTTNARIYGEFLAILRTKLSSDRPVGT